MTRLKLKTQPEFNYKAMPQELNISSRKRRAADARMQASEEGQRIMADKPRIHTSTIDFKYLETLPPDTFGASYVKFLKDNVSRAGDKKCGTS